MNQRPESHVLHKHDSKCKHEHEKHKHNSKHEHKKVPDFVVFLCVVCVRARVCQHE